MNIRRGFTLIELIVVIAIISILSAVVISNIGNARDRSANASVKANLNSLRAMIAIFYDANGNYGTAGVNGCTSGGMFNSTSPNDISGAISEALQSSGHTGGIYCRSNTSTNQWAIAVPLRPLTGNNSTQQAWCVDFRGISKQVTFGSFSTSQCP